uniref:Uncharacterized protein n=1 Tax=Chromera velia CCMP2878 TaxID=1169474 RepID=A0A0G4FMH8_9ALVE|eukprot:Cvel_17704.t1-p1 / transcript=Cvel_17704.t1 / gene=Cvel_17704 / organism=Chromera_velia_CCMP2878 / gene_product=hypothetical protein / transcript_product=hypothetical protein / location=Cvel_scaffold1429:16178-17479(+) / protein_length=116 / sequence_SO=supercontig / SO=protein_coding / is_pseudo=false
MLQRGQSPYWAVEGVLQTPPSPTSLTSALFPPYPPLISDYHRIPEFVWAEIYSSLPFQADAKAAEEDDAVRCESPRGRAGGRAEGGYEWREEGEEEEDEEEDEEEEAWREEEEEEE